MAALAFACGGGGDKEVSPTETSAPEATVTPVAQIAPPGPTTFGVLAGGTDGPVDIEQFMPATVRIRAGDTIHWTGHGHEGHTVTFFPDGRLNIGPNEYLIPASDQPDTLEFNPVFAVGSDAQGSYDGTEYTNSGFFGVPNPGEYTLTFPKAGAYPYLCMIHPFIMRGVVIVEDNGTQVPAPETIAAEGEQLKQRFAAGAKTAAQAVNDERPASAKTDGGGRMWGISVGIDTPQAQVTAFLPGALEIEAGDTVVFWNSDRDFHNLVFVPDGQDPPPFPIIKPSDKGGFRLLINPDAVKEVPPPPNFGPDDYFSAGMMGIGFPRFYYDVTFTQPGTYRFVCTVHVLSGMSGAIEVRPKDSA